jgi:hypothetical protein
MAAKAAATTTVVLSERFETIGEVRLDERKRVSLTRALESLRRFVGAADTLRFMVYVNDAGQVLLSPSVSMPLHEVWLYKNPAALASVKRGLAQLKKPARLHDLGSFAKFADDEID